MEFPIRIPAYMLHVLTLLLIACLISYFHIYRPSQMGNITAWILPFWLGCLMVDMGVTILGLLLFFLRIIPPAFAEEMTFVLTRLYLCFPFLGRIMLTLILFVGSYFLIGRPIFHIQYDFVGLDNI